MAFSLTALTTAISIPVSNNVTAFRAQNFSETGGWYAGEIYVAWNGNANNTVPVSWDGNQGDVIIIPYEVTSNKQTDGVLQVLIEQTDVPQTIVFSLKRVNGQVLTTTVEVPPYYPLGMLYLTSSLVIPVGQTEMLIPYNEDGDIATGVIWSSSNYETASVENDGNVRANDVGTATITVSGGGYAPASCTVEVRGKNNQGTFNNSTQYQSEFLFGDARSDAPELAHRGPYGVGLRELNVAYTTTAARSPLKVDVWYPAVIPEGMEELAWITTWAGQGLNAGSNRASRPFDFPVRALRNAAPDDSGAGERGYPILMFSHGANGSSSQYTNTFSNLASKGYIVISVDHTGNSAGTNSNSSAGSPSARNTDLRYILDCVEQASITAESFLFGMADAHNTAVMGHSMGGGASLMMGGSTGSAATAADPRVKAIIPVAPWTSILGGNNISHVTIPILMIGGTMDDTAAFSGQKSKYDSISNNTDAYFLVYQGGNHEMVIDAPSYFLASGLNASTYWGHRYGSVGSSPLEPWKEWREFIFSTEPMWDEARISNINQHFITAFLDLHMKGDTDKRAYLDVPYPIATVNSRYEMIYNYGGLGHLENWKGFQPWTAAGLELYHKGPQRAFAAPTGVPVTKGRNIDPFVEPLAPVAFDRDTAGTNREYFRQQDGEQWLNPTMYGPDFQFGDARTDAPQFAYRGAYGVGVKTINTIMMGQTDLSGDDYNRPLKMEVWYPALIPDGVPEECTYYEYTGIASDPTRPNVAYERSGRALRDAEAVTSAGAFPVVVLSHGVDGSRLLLSYLGENLASKGFIVVSIEHTDSTKLGNINAMSLKFRALDDIFALDTMDALGVLEGSFLEGIVDADNAALGGYSFGGYGVLNAAGVPSSAGSTNPEADPRIKALIAIAPYNALFSNDALLELTIPTLFITGTADQTVPYSSVKRVFEGARNADRYMLVYQAGDHEVGSSNTPWIAHTDKYTNSPVMPDGPLGPDWQTWREYMFYYEPAWDQGKLNNVNQHFVTVFLNKFLKGENVDMRFLNFSQPIADLAGQSSYTSSWLGFKDYSISGAEFHHRLPDRGGVLDFALVGPPSSNANSVSFTFSAPTGATTVRVRFSIDGGYTWANATTSPATLNASSTSATVTGLSSRNYFGDVYYLFKLQVTGGPNEGESPEILYRWEAPG